MDPDVAIYIDSTPINAANSAKGAKSQVQGFINACVKAWTSASPLSMSLSIGCCSPTIVGLWQLHSAPMIPMSSNKADCTERLKQPTWLVKSWDNYKGIVLRKSLASLHYQLDIWLTHRFERRSAPLRVCCILSPSLYQLYTNTNISHFCAYVYMSHICSSAGHPLKSWTILRDGREASWCTIWD